MGIEYSERFVRVSATVKLHRELCRTSLFGIEKARKKGGEFEDALASKKLTADNLKRAFAILITIQRR